MQGTCPPSVSTFPSDRHCLQTKGSGAWVLMLFHQPIQCERLELSYPDLSSWEQGGLKDSHHFLLPNLLLTVILSLIMTMEKKVSHTSRKPEHPIYRQIGRHIQDLRRKTGIPQDKMAAKMGLHRSHLGEIERGECNLTLKTLCSVARTLQTTIYDLFKGAETISLTKFKATPVRRPKRKT